jgi:hypothetical protein
MLALYAKRSVECKQRTSYLGFGGSDPERLGRMPSWIADSRLWTDQTPEASLVPIQKTTTLMKVMKPSWHQNSRDGRAYVDLPRASDAWLRGPRCLAWRCHWPCAWYPSCLVPWQCAKGKQGDCAARFAIEASGFNGRRWRRMGGKAGTRSSCPTRDDRLNGRV